MSASRISTLLRAASALTLVAAIQTIPAIAQNPAAAPAAPMTCDSACHMRMMGPGGGMGAMGGAGMQGGMMCPMMGQMQGQGGMPMGGMHRMHGMGMMGGMGGMQGMGQMNAAPDTADMRTMADRHAMMTRAYYEALVRRGFSAQQALQIVSAGMQGPGR